MRPAAKTCRLSAILLLASLSPSVAAVAVGASDFGDGWRAYESGDFSRAVVIWTALAERGHVNAQVNLGHMYDHGTGVERDHQLAAQWYRAAAFQDSAVGQYNLSMLIAEGHAESSAGRSARYWLQRAAAQGFEDARAALGHDWSATPAGPDIEAKTGAAGNGAPKEDTPGISVSTGTAWPVAAGYAVTNHHIVDHRQQVTLVNRGGDEILAEVVASDPDHDIAFLRVSGSAQLPPALPLSPRSAGLGASVFTIGFPRIDVMGKNPKLSHGIISGEYGLRDDPSRYQISVPIQQGNSGGPLLNMRGEVVGMITTMLGERSASGGQARPIPNIGYAVKIDAIKRFLAQLPRSEVDRPGLRPTSGDLENLAARVQESVLIVMAE